MLPTSDFSPAAELLPQRRHDRLPIGGILAGLVLVEADDVAAALDPHLLDLQRRRVRRWSALGMHDPIATGPGQDLVLDLVLRSHPGAQDVLPASLLLLQLLDRLLADHAPIGHDADLGDAEPAAEPIDHRDERRHVGRVAGPQFTADRSPLTVEHGPDDHLLEVGPMVLAVAALADRLSAFSLEVDRGRVEEDQLELGEQVAPAGEQSPPR